MYIADTSNHGKRYLKLMKSINVKCKNGKYKRSNKVILNIGYLDKFDDGKPDYIERLRQSFKEGQPLIENLNPYAKPSTIDKSVIINYNISKIYSNILLDQMFKYLGLSQLFTLHKSRNNIKYDLLGVVKLLTYGGVLNPKSKKATFDQKIDYYGVVCDSNKQHIVYNTLEIIADKRINILRAIYKTLDKNMGIGNELIFYDTTNFYAGTDQEEDKRIIDSVKVKELGQSVSNENKRIPITKIGLFMDKKGLPISFETFNDNKVDQTILSKTLKKTIKDFDFSRYILVADRGRCSTKKKISILNENNGYIINQSITKSNIELKRWIVEKKDYKYNENRAFKIKSKIIIRMQKDENGKDVKITEKVIIYMSEKNQENYVLTTSEVKMKDIEIINIYRRLPNIAHCLNMINKDTEQPTSIYVRTKEHILAHFIICFMALTLIRLIQYKIKDVNNEEIEIQEIRIQKALNEWKVDEITEGFYKFQKINEDLNLILSIYNVKIEEKSYTANDLKKVRSEIII